MTWGANEWQLLLDLSVCFLEGGAIIVVVYFLALSRSPRRPVAGNTLE